MTAPPPARSRARAYVLPGEIRTKSIPKSEWSMNGQIHSYSLHDGSVARVRCPRARATPVFRTRPLSSRERPRETRAAPRGARGEAGRKRTRTRPHTERGHTQTAEALCWLGWRGPVATRLHHARLLECLPVGPGRQRSADREKHDRARHDLFNSVATIADPGR